MNDTAELWHPWCCANESCLHRGIPKPNWCASCYGTLSSSLSSTSFFKPLVAIAISGSAHLSLTNSPSCFPAACVANVWIRNPIWTQMHLQGLLYLLLLGWYSRARGVTVYQKDYIAHVTLQRRLFLLWSETSRSMDASLTPVEAPVFRLGCGCVPCLSWKPKQGHAKVINSEVLFFVAFHLRNYQNVPSNAAISFFLVQ